MEERSRRRLFYFLISFIPGGVVAIPLAFYLATTQTKYHPYWNSFFTALIGFWIVVSLLVSLIPWYMSRKRFIKDRYLKKGT